MGALNYIAAVLFAALFIGIGFTLYSQYQQAAPEREFKLKAEELAGKIKELGNMSTGSSFPNFEIYVPSNCELSFVDNTVVISIGEWSDNFAVDVPVSGPTFTNQQLTLKLERTENGVDVSAA